MEKPEIYSDQKSIRNINLFESEIYSKQKSIRTRNLFEPEIYSNQKSIRTRNVLDFYSRKQDEKKLWGYKVVPNLTFEKMKGRNQIRRMSSEPPKRAQNLFKKVSEPCMLVPPPPWLKQTHRQLNKNYQITFFFTQTNNK